MKMKRDSTKRPWQSMRLTCVGHLAAVMQAKPGSKPDGLDAPKH